MEVAANAKCDPPRLMTPVDSWVYAAVGELVKPPDFQSGNYGFKPRLQYDPGV